MTRSIFAILCLVVLALLVGVLRSVESLTCGGERRPSVVAYRKRQRALERRFECLPWFTKTQYKEVAPVSHAFEPRQPDQFAEIQTLGDTTSEGPLPSKRPVYTTESHRKLMETPPIVQKPARSEEGFVPLDTSNTSNALQLDDFI